MKESSELLREFVETSSEQAFSDLVKNHVDMVYSTALRKLAGDTHLAQDVTQTVFTDLARKAKSLPHEVVLGGWLYRHTCFRSSEAVRTERRRQVRELKAMEMNALQDQSESRWEAIAPLLDEAMTNLSTRDRNAVVLRFFEHRDLRSVGATLGLNDDAAQKCVSRAVDKLRAFFAKRGVTLSATGLSAALGAQAVVSAPAGLAASVVGPALAAVTLTSGSALAFAKMLLMAKLKSGALGATLAAGLAAVLVFEHASNTRLRNEVAGLRGQSEALGKARQPTPAPDATLTAELSRLRAEHSELMRLRDEVGRLRKEVSLADSAPGSKAGQGKPSGTAEANQANAVEQLTRTGQFLPSERLADIGSSDPAAAMQSYLWALTQPDRRRARELASGIPEERLRRLAEEFTGSMSNAEGIQFDALITSPPEDADGRSSVVTTIKGAGGTEQTKRINLRLQGQNWVVISDEWTPIKAVFSRDLRPVDQEGRLPSDHGR